MAPGQSPDSQVEFPDAPQPSLAICCRQGKIMVPQAHYFEVAGYRNPLAGVENCSQVVGGQGGGGFAWLLPKGSVLMASAW